MKFNRNSRLDTSQIRDRRGAGTGLAVGGGVSGLVLLVLLVLTGADPSSLVDAGGSQGGGPAGPSLQECRTGEDIERRAECRFVAMENSVQDYWADALDGDYRPASFNVFTGAVSTGCGQASSQVGPFYCPTDEGVYLDLGFFDELRSTFGARGGDLAEAYVIAHEYGHHVQHLTGQMDRVRSRQGEDSDAVRLELQADCYAGVWVHHATRTLAEDGEPVITDVSEDDLAEALDAARVIGDDHLQRQAGGSVDPDGWTHGSSDQRRAWLRTGWDTGDPGACDTFSARL